jgi:Lrp/AsnC family transcriptional regulator for asnA, asnC and gidA
MFQTDSIDEQIIAIMLEDGRNPVREVARRLGASAAAVRQRLKRMKEAKALSIAVVTDPSATGLDASAYLFVDCKPSHTVAAATSIANLEDINFVGIMAGGTAILAVCAVRDQSELISIVNDKIGVISGVQRVTVRVIAGVFKHNYTVVRIG